MYTKFRDNMGKNTRIIFQNMKRIQSYIYIYIKGQLFKN